MAEPKACCLCGGPIKGLGNRHLAYGGWVCKECAERIDAWHPNLLWVNTTQDVARSWDQQMAQTTALMAQLKQLADVRRAQFAQTRSFDGPAGAIVLVDDRHRLVAFSVDGAAVAMPNLAIVILAISEMASARAGADGQVLVATNIVGLPNLPIQMPDAGFDGPAGDASGYLTVEPSGQNSGWQQAAQVADFINALINPPPVAAYSGADELAKWKALLDSGGISQPEYDAKKEQLLGLG